MQKIKKILSNPKIVTGIAFLVALIIGIFSYVSYNNTLKNRFANIDKISSTATSTGTTNLSSQDLTLAFPMGGRIKGVYVKIGDTVKAGEILASIDAENTIGAINQAKASYLSAQTAYEKLLNGATNQDVAVTQSSVDSATTALNNAKQNLMRDIATSYNSVNSAILSNTNSLFSNPEAFNPQFVISGTVQTNGQLITNINNERVNINSNLSKWQNEISSIDENNLDQTVADSKVYINDVRSYLSDLLNILTNYTQVSSGGSQTTVAVDQNAVNSTKAISDTAFATITNDAQAVKSAISALNQAQASLSLKQAPARSEDLDIAKAQVQSMQGALQIAEGSYNNTVIIAPVDGKITNVSITAGQIATANTPAIELLSK